MQKRFPGTRPVKLAQEDEAEEGICVKNDKGMAAVFSTGVMGSPDTLTAIYLAPARLVEKTGLTCQVVKSHPKQFATASGLSVGLSSVKASKLLRAKSARSEPVLLVGNI